MSARLRIGDVAFDGDIRLDFSELNGGVAILFEDRRLELRSSGVIREPEAGDLRNYAMVAVTALTKLNAFATLCAALFEAGSLLKVTGLGIPAFIKAVAVAKPILLLLLAL